MSHRRRFDAILDSFAKKYLFCILGSCSFVAVAERGLKSGVPPPPHTHTRANREFVCLNARSFYKTLFKTVIKNMSLIAVRPAYYTYLYVKPIKRQYKIGCDV